MKTPNDYDALLKELLRDPLGEASTLDPDDDEFLKKCIRNVRSGKPGLLIWQADGSSAYQFMLCGMKFGEAFTMIGQVISVMGDKLRQENR